jgi:hypothetical protein
MAAGIATGVLGFLLFGIGLRIDPHQALLSYLVAYATGLSLTLGALTLVMIGHLTGAAWLAPFRRAVESIATTTPIFALLFLPLAVGLNRLYPWAPPLSLLSERTRESIEAKAAYLNVPFFLVRAAVYFTVWITVGVLLRRWSIRQVREQSDHLLRAQRVLSATTFPAVGLTLSFAAFDWMMSLSPEWFSTIYGVYFFAGGFLGALALLGVVASPASRAGLLPTVPGDSYHALGKLLLTFVMFWAYVGFCQLFIIWIADLPVEVAWYAPRLHGSWGTVALVLLLGNFVAPFLVLLFRTAKRTPAVLAATGGWLLAMHYLDVYWLLMPELHASGVRVHWLDLATLGAVTGPALAFGAWQLRRHALASGTVSGLRPVPEPGG